MIHAAPVIVGGCLHRSPCDSCMLLTNAALVDKSKHALPYSLPLVVGHPCVHCCSLHRQWFRFRPSLSLCYPPSPSCIQPCAEHYSTGAPNPAGSTCFHRSVQDVCAGSSWPLCQKGGPRRHIRPILGELWLWSIGQVAIRSRGSAFYDRSDDPVRRVPVEGRVLDAGPAGNAPPCDTLQRP